MNRSQPTSMSASFHSHGLAGIDLHHTCARRDEELAANSISRAAGKTSTGLVRQRIGSLMIAFGNHLAGNRPVQTQTARLV